MTVTALCSSNIITKIRRTKFSSTVGGWPKGQAPRSLCGLEGVVEWPKIPQTHTYSLQTHKPITQKCSGMFPEISLNGPLQIRSPESSVIGRLSIIPFRFLVGGVVIDVAGSSVIRQSIPSDCARFHFQSSPLTGFERFRAISISKCEEFLNLSDWFDWLVGPSSRSVRLWSKVEHLQQYRGPSNQSGSRYPFRE